MADLLLELFSEEIPARMQLQAEYELFSALKKQLSAAGIKVPETVQERQAVLFSTPRRIAILLKDIDAVQPDINTELKGPKVGAPQAAIDGFLKKSGMTLDELTQVDGVYVAKIHRKGGPTADVLKPIIEEILASFPWPKSMRWGSSDTTWVRPLHSILCIFDGKVVPVEFAGVKADNITHGHRFLSPKEITIKSAGDYEKALEKAYVIADRGKRRDEILKQANTIAGKMNMKLRENEKLLDEVTGLVEWPVVLMGEIDKDYRDLPAEVLMSEMQEHQKYFPLRTDTADFVGDKFLITSNMEAGDKGKAIVAGNERVLRARLADGRFFWDQDRKKKLEDMAAGLASVTYHAKLGSVADKVERVSKLAGELTTHVKADVAAVKRACALSKADLVSGMVGEFPELQGVMGRYYALHQKEKPEVADAIRDHYLPLGPSSDVPKKPVSVCVALADKLDTLISMFAIGEKPTGSKDPFALRRAALGVIRIILENNIRLPLSIVFDNAPMREIALHKAHDKLAKQTEARLKEASPGKVGKYLSVNESASEDIPEGASENVGKALLAFFHDRLIVQLKDSGIRHDVIKAVAADGDDDLLRIVNRAKALQQLLESQDGEKLLTGYKRAVNILTVEEKKDKQVYAAKDLDAAILQQKEETALAERLGKLPARLAEHVAADNFIDAMRLLAGLRIVIDEFFDETMVNCDNPELRANRLRLLASIRDCMNSVADFSKIEGDAKEQKKAA